MAQNVTAQEFADISILYARYNQASNNGDAEEYADCFTADAILVNDMAGHKLHGRDELLVYKRKEADTRTNEYRRHWTGSMLLQKQPDGTVHGRCYLLVFGAEAMTLPEILVAGIYEDRIVRINGSWRFAARIVRIDGRRGSIRGS